MDQKNDCQSDEEINFENPNFRKLKATLNIKTTSVNNDDIKTKLNNAVNDEAVKKLEEDINLSKLNEQIKNLEKKINQKCDAKNLPKNWEKYQDDKGLYYWHVPTGTIQREFPIENSDDEQLSKNDSIFYLEDEEAEENESSKLLRSFNEINKEQSFIVYSLGSMDFDEQKLTAELSSKAIQKCIIELTTKGDNNAVRCYGSYGTKKLILKIENSCIKLYDIPTKKVLHIQQIHSIKVWGINGNNDFAYVAADSNANQKPLDKTDQISNDNNHSNDVSPQASPLKNKSKLRCHIFHCEEKLDNKMLEEFGNEAQCIANMLKEEVIKYKMSQSENQNQTIDDYDTSPESCSLDFSCFVEDSTKTVIANYLGKMIVDKPVGIDVINRAIELVTLEKNEPIVCLVHISPSNLIIENTNTSENELECKLSRLSFLGISQNNTKQSAFIIQNLDDKFEAHVFECRPNSASLCRFIQEACKLRFERCMEAHKKRCDESNSVLIRNGSSKAAALKGKIMNAFSKIMMK